MKRIRQFLVNIISLCPRCEEWAIRHLEPERCCPGCHWIADRNTAWESCEGLNKRSR